MQTYFGIGWIIGSFQDYADLFWNRLDNRLASRLQTYFGIGWIIG